MNTNFNLFHTFSEEEVAEIKELLGRRYAIHTSVSDCRTNAILNGGCAYDLPNFMWYISVIDDDMDAGDDTISSAFNFDEYSALTFSMFIAHLETNIQELKDRFEKFYRTVPVNMARGDEVCSDVSSKAPVDSKWVNGKWVKCEEGFDINDIMAKAKVNKAKALSVEAYEKMIQENQDNILNGSWTYPTLHRKEKKDEI